jgi:hypothetical protein
MEKEGGCVANKKTIQNSDPDGKAKGGYMNRLGKSSYRDPDRIETLTRSSRGQGTGERWGQGRASGRRLFSFEGKDQMGCQAAANVSKKGKATKETERLHPPPLRWVVGGRWDIQTGCDRLSITHRRKKSLKAQPRGSDNPPPVRLPTEARS